MRTLPWRGTARGGVEGRNFVVISRSSFEYVRDVVARRAGFRFEQGLEYLLESRLLALARHYKTGSVNEFIRMMKAGSIADSEQALVEALADKETSFFRDVRPFETLRRNIIPELATKRNAQQKFSVWCAGCSTGQEAYSIALLLRESFPEFQTWDLRILATDLSEEALRAARTGLYNQIEVNRGLPVSLLVKYLQKEGLAWRLKEEIRQMVQFSQMNLLESSPPAHDFDVILLRNVLSSFPAETQTEVLKRARRCLLPDGYLLLGLKEAPGGIGDLFEEVRFDKIVSYRPRPGGRDEAEAESTEAQKLNLLESWARLALLAIRRSAGGGDEWLKAVEEEADLKTRLINSVQRESGDTPGAALSVEDAVSRLRREQLFAVAISIPIVRALNESFLGMLSVGLQPVALPPGEGDGQEQIFGALKISGAATGRMVVRLKPDLARDLTVEALGLSPEDVGPEVINDLMGQVLSLISNTVNANLASAGLGCKFESAEVTRALRSKPALPAKAALEPFTFQYQGHPVWLDIVVNALEQK